MTGKGVMAIVALVVLAGAAPAAVPPQGGATTAGADGARDEGVQRLLAEAFPDGAEAAPAGGRDLFLAVLGSELFLHGESGPFDVYVEKADGLKKSSDAKKALQHATEGLAALAPVMERSFGRAGGAVSGRRFPIVICSTRRERDETAFDDLLALLDECEDRGFSGWKPDLPLWNDASRAAATARNWDVLLVNVAHPDVAAQDRAFWDHGLGYEALNQVCNRLFAKGCWGPPPPWLRQGLLDELDIEAYGTAWVAAGESSSWSSHTDGWRREGWSGFLPEGQQPPPPVTGPPPGLSKSFTSKVESDDWLARADSASRHWTSLVSDRKSEAPASLCAMAAAQRYASRDRAFARCVLFVLLQGGGGEGLLAALDREGAATETGMRDADPLPVAVARALCDLPELSRLEARPLQDVLAAAGRDDMLKRIRDLGAEELLSISDHRDQARWLWRQTLDNDTRQTLFRCIVEAEATEELGEWEVVGQALDRAMAAALAASSSFPKQDERLRSVGEEFRNALASPAPDGG